MKTRCPRPLDEGDSVCREAANSIGTEGFRQESRQLCAWRSVMVAAAFVIVFVDDVYDTQNGPDSDTQNDDDGERDDAGQDLFLIALARVLCPNRGHLSPL